MAEGNNSFAGGDIIEWNHQKITDYFAECGKVYDTFEESINEVAIALNDFVNDGEHRGPEAESAKSFVNERQIQAVEEAIYSVEHLHGMMEGSRLSDEVSLLDAFNEKVDASETAIVKSQQLDKVITDYTEYNNGFRTDSDTIKTARDACQDAVSGCSFLTYTHFTEPDPEPTKETMEAFVSVENEDGFVQKFEKTFLEFIEEHDDDFTGSEFMAICPVLLENLKNVNAALGDGSFDLTRYDETFKNVRWTDVKGLISEEMRNKFLKYMKDFNLYLKGCLEKCQVIKYDPVNMNNGNYINDRTDLTVSGRFPIDFRRFYNAQSERCGILGKGWSCAFDGRLRKDMDGDIRLTTFDGRELIFSKANIKKEEVYLEVHGEEGVLRETQTGYVITRDDGSYDEYDLDGFLVARGDNNGEHTRVDYAVINVSGKTAVEDADENVSEATSYIAVPVKIATKDGASLSLRYNEAGILKEIEDHTGRKCTFEYELKLVNRDNEETYFLKSVTYPNGSSRIYNYNDQGLIASVKSPDGVVALENEYDEKRRVIHQSFPDGGEMSYEYDDENRITTATEQNGCKVQYLSDEFGRHVGTRYVGIRPGQVSMDETLESDTYTIEEKFTYNDKNQKTTVTDRNGFVTRYLYDNRGRLVSTIGPEGLHEIITYDAEGHMTSKKDSNGNKYKYSYDLDGNLYCVRDPEGNRIKYDYVEGKLVSKRDGFGKKTEFSYDENGNVKSITEPTGKKTFYEYDSLGRAIKSIDAEGNATCYTYDNDGNITSVTDPLGNVTRHTYNKAGLLVETVNPDGTKKTWQYNEIGRPASFTDEDGRTTRMLYNTMWQEAKTILPNGGEISYKYDLLGNRISVTDPENRITKFTHDKMGNVLTEGHVVSSKEDVLEIVSVNKTYTYDAKNRVKTETDGEGNVTTYKYDKNDNLICKIDALGGVTTNEYDGLNRLVKTTDPAGRTTSYTFDKNGNLKTTTDPSGVITENHYDNNLLIKVTQRAKSAEDIEITINEYTYDELGRMITQTERDGFTFNYEYDKAGRSVKTTASNGRIIEYSYDPMGRVTEKKDCEAVTKYAYTGTGKLCSVIDALGNETRYSYNELDLLCKIERFDGLGNSNFAKTEEADFGIDFVNSIVGETDANSSQPTEKEIPLPQVDRNGHVTIYTHDLSGKVISVTDALGNKDVYKYDNKGELCSQTDRDGNETIYTRDNNGNITGIKYSNGEEVRYSYNALNILKQVEDHLGITKIESDSVGRTSKVITPDGQTVGYEYGPNDEKAAIIYPNGKRLEYKYDAYGKLVELSDLNAETGSVQYYYDSNARLIKKSFPNGTTTSYDYYQGGLLKTLVNTDREGVLDRFEYSYNQKGNRTSIEKTRRGLDNVSGIYTYSYDEIGRLEGVSREGEILSSYTYDAFGNRISKFENNTKTFYSYDVQDRLVSKSEQSALNPAPVITTYSYDNRGNLVAEYNNDILDREYTFNARNLLEKVQIKTDSSQNHAIYYDYNYLGQRINKKADNTEVSYLIDITMDHNNLLAQSVNGQTSMFTYDDKVVSMENEDTSSFYLLDELGSTMYLTGTDGISSDAYAYDVFGNRVDVNTGKKVVLESLIQPFTFTGYREEENGLYFAQARSYDSETGRFTGEDKVRGYLEIPDSINHYLYCYNDPKAYIDRNGLTPTDPGQGNSSSQPNGSNYGTTTSGAANGSGNGSNTQSTGGSGSGGYANGSVKLPYSSTDPDIVMLHNLGLSDEAIKEALDAGLTLEILIGYYKSFGTEDASKFFTMILEQKYDEAFDYLINLDDPFELINDDNLMNALALYSMGIVKLDSVAKITEESAAKFTTFMNAVVNAVGDREYPWYILEKLYAHSSILADGFTKSVCAIDYNADIEYFKTMNYEATKRNTIAALYATEYDFVYDNYMYAFRNQLDFKITGVSYENGKMTLTNSISNRMPMGNGNFNDIYNLCVSLKTEAGAQKTAESVHVSDNLKKEKIELLQKLVNNVIKDSSTVINPILGATVKVLFDIGGKDTVSGVKDASFLIKTVLSTAKVAPSIAAGIPIAGDVVEYFIKCAKIDDKIDANNAKIKTEWFAYYYSQFDGTFNDYFAMESIRPDAFVVMREWEKGGFNAVFEDYVINRMKYTSDQAGYVKGVFDRLVEEELRTNTELSDDQKHLINVLVYGNCGGETLDFSSINYDDFIRCVQVLDDVMTTLDENVSKKNAKREVLNADGNPLPEEYVVNYQGAGNIRTIFDEVVNQVC